MRTRLANAQTTTQHLSGLLQRVGTHLEVYQEDIDLETVTASSSTSPAGKPDGPFHW